MFLAIKTKFAAAGCQGLVKIELKTGAGLLNEPAHPHHHHLPAMSSRIAISNVVKLVVLINLT